jgi:hypothetical protein
MNRVTALVTGLAALTIISTAASAAETVPTARCGHCDVEYKHCVEKHGRSTQCSESRTLCFAMLQRRCTVFGSFVRRTLIDTPIARRHPGPNR